MSFIKSFNDAYLFQHIEKPTRYRQGQKSNILDLVFTRENSDIIEIEYLCPIGKSDHLTLKLITNIDKIAMEDDTPPRFDFKRCNITDFRRLIKETDWTVLHKLNVEECWNLIYSKLDEGMEKFVPKVDIKSRKKSPPWMNPFVKKSIKKKHKLFKKLFNSNNSYVYKLYMNARNESARIVKNAKKNYQKDMASKIDSNPKVFWRYINSNRKNKDGIAPLSTDNINFETNNKNKADMLNNFFSSVFTVEDLNNIPDTTPGEKSNNCFISDIIVTEHAVRD